MFPGRYVKAWSEVLIAQKRINRASVYCVYGLVATKGTHIPKSCAVKTVNTFDVLLDLITGLFALFDHTDLN